MILKQREKMFRMCLDKRISKYRSNVAHSPDKYQNICRAICFYEEYLRFVAIAFRRMSWKSRMYKG
jgi:hypothetical protein